MLGTGLALGLARTSAAWWPEGALFAADFINNRFMSGGVAIPAASAYSFTRASSKRAVTSTGQWQVFGDNVPAITDLGLSLEPASTNLLPNSSFVGGTAASYTAVGSTNLPNGFAIRNLPAGCTAETAYGTESGLPYMDLRVFGTATNNTPFVLVFCPNNTVACTTGQTLQVSLSARLVVGVIPISATVRLYEYDAGGINTATADTAALDLSGSLGRHSREYVASNVTTTNVLPGIRMGIGNGSTVDFTLRILAPQIERQTAPATSPILTTTAIGDRADDNMSCTLPLGTAVVQYRFADGALIAAPATPGLLAVPPNLSTRNLVLLAALGT